MFEIFNKRLKPYKTYQTNNTLKLKISTLFFSPTAKRKTTKIHHLYAGLKTDYLWYKLCECVCIKIN
jgi:hypothetical protein